MQKATEEWNKTKRSRNEDPSFVEDIIDKHHSDEVYIDLITNFNYFNNFCSNRI